VTTALTIPQQVEQALAFTATRDKLIALAADSQRIVAITNKASYDECHNARMTLKSTRVEIEKTGKDARDEAIRYQKAVIAAEKELIGLIEPEEARLKALQDAEDARKEAEKQARARAEAERLAKQTAWFDAVKALPLAAMNKTVAEIDALIAQAEATTTDELAADMVDAGRFTIRTTVMALRAAKDARAQDDAEQARQAAEREAERLRVEAQLAELAQLREQVERERKAAEAAAAEAQRQMEAERRAREAAEGEVRAAQEAEAKRAREAQAATERAERERIAAEQKAEADRLAAERKKLEDDKRAADKRAREQAIATATLYEAAAEAHALLLAEGFGDHLTTLKLGAALNRDSAKAAA
jgi:hypothetical protein